MDLREKIISVACGIVMLSIPLGKLSYERNTGTHYTRFEDSSITWVSYDRTKAYHAPLIGFGITQWEDTDGDGTFDQKYLFSVAGRGVGRVARKTAMTQEDPQNSEELLAELGY